MAFNPRTSDSNGRLWGARAEDWANIQEPVQKPIYQSVFDATQLDQGVRYLDVGCGSGLAVQIADARGAIASGLDAAQELLEIAQSRTPNASFQVGDLEALPFEDGAYDLVTGFNSFQYAGNPALALAEAKRVVSDNGSVVIATWGEPEGMEAASVVAALKPLMPPPPPGTPGPFALSDENALRDFAKQASLHPVEVFDVDSPFEYTNLETAVLGLSSAGVAAKVMEAVGVDLVENAYRDAIAGFVQTDGSVKIAATFRCLVATPNK